MTRSPARLPAVGPSSRAPGALRSAPGRDGSLVVARQFLGWSPFVTRVGLGEGRGVGRGCRALRYHVETPRCAGDTCGVCRGRVSHPRRLQQAGHWCTVGVLPGPTRVTS